MSTCLFACQRKLIKTKTEPMRPIEKEKPNMLQEHDFTGQEHKNIHLTITRIPKPNEK